MHLCIVTAYAEEGDLFTHIRNARELARPFAERQVLDWVAQIALALDHIHALRVMHRDLKTQNIFLGRGGVVKLGDFGISRVLERTDDFATTVAGTPYYLSPEVCQNQPYTLKSDVWSFGCVAYEIATLRHAFAADSLLSLVYQIVNGTCPPVPADRYDARFCGLVERYASPGQRGTPVRRVPRCSRRSCRTTCGDAARRAGKAAQRGGAAAGPLVGARSRRRSKEARMAGARPPADAPARLHEKTPKTPKTAVTPKPRNEWRSVDAKPPRRARPCSWAAATEQTDLSKEAFRRSFTAGLSRL